MNLDNLKKFVKQKKIVNNYKELCAILEEEPKKSNSKIAQLKNWEQFFSFEKIKNSNKIKIKEIYDEPKLLINSQGSPYKQNVAQIILYFLLQDKQTITISPIQLGLECGFCNDLFTLYAFNYDKFISDRNQVFENSYVYPIDERNFLEFVRDKRNSIIGIVERVINSLEKQGLIMKQDVWYGYSHNENFNENSNNKIFLSDSEKEIYKNIEAEIFDSLLDEFNQKTNKNLKVLTKLDFWWYPPIQKKFFHLLNQKCKQELGCSHIHKEWILTLTKKDYLVRIIERNYQKELVQIKQEINNKYISNIIDNLDKWLLENPHWSNNGTGMFLFGEMLAEQGNYSYVNKKELVNTLLLSDANNELYKKYKNLNGQNNKK